jgi:transposase
MINITFTPAEVEALQYERYHHPHPRVQRKMDALYLKSQGYAHEEIARLLNISPTTLRSYLRQYQVGGIEGLKQLNFYKPQSALAPHRASLEEYFRAHPVATAQEAMAVIEKVTGIKRSPSQVRRYLHAIGVERRKVGVVPAKADIQVQETFKTQQLEPRLEEAKAGQRALFFVDASHFVLGAFLGFLWSFARVFVKTPSGRQRFNVLGALNAITHEILTVVNNTYITAEQVCQLLQIIAARNLGVAITVVLDNARYQRCALVQALALSLNIELLFLPPYSPNLNLIERVWKFVKKQCLYSKYYEDFASFKAAIYQCITQAHIKHKKELASLLTLKFQTFENVSL